MVTVEVPEGYKFCKGCGGVFDKVLGFYQQKKFSKATGGMKLYPFTMCKSCNDCRLRATQRKTPTRTPQKPADLPRVAVEIVEAAWLECQVVFRRAGKLQWRARHRDIPPGAEIIGAYDKGARYDRVLADLTA